MSELQDILNVVSQVCLVVFSITTVIMLFYLKKHGYSPEGVHVKYKFDFNLDLRIFGDLRKGYQILKDNSIIPRTNCISMYLGIFCVVTYFIITVCSEAMR